MIGYVYRHDEIKSLQEQRKTDKVLRAHRRYGTTAECKHHQVIAALKKASTGQGVYRICFWKNLECARQFLFKPSDNVIQRIKSDHKFLLSCNRDDDEHLSDCAFIYWKTTNVESKKKDWSPDGISHEDIEILLPDGSWVPMNDAEIFQTL